MTTEANRLVSSYVEPQGQELEFTFEGEKLVALAGETIAAALTASGHLDLRQHGDGERRGIYCGMGACQECLVEIDGRGSQRACMTKVVAGASIRRHDPALSALAPLAPCPHAELPVELCEIAIVGAGPAALAAAKTIATAGIHVIIVDERSEPGGQYYKPLAPSHKFVRGPSDRQFADGERLKADVIASGVEIRTSSLVWQATRDDDGKPQLSISGPSGTYVLGAHAVLLAPGAYEAPHHVPGWTLPGVMTAGAAQTLARSYRVSPGQRVLVAGNGPLNWQVALELARGGANVAGILESARPGRAGQLPALVGMSLASPRATFDGLRIRAELSARRITIHEGMMVTAIEGAERVERVIARDENGSVQEFAVDAVSLGYGFIPAADLLRHFGGAVDVDPATGFPLPVLSPTGRSSVEQVWMAGDGARVRGSQVALTRGAVAANDMLAYLGRSPSPARGLQRRYYRAERFQTALWRLFAPAIKPPEPTDDTIICRCESVTAGTVRRHAAAGVDDLASLKRLTRLGMGRCQGRYCAGAAMRLFGQDMSRLQEADLFAPQAPVRPVPAIVLAREKGEWGGHREAPTRIVPRGAGRADPLPATCDLLVIGAGITGAATAMFAAQNGMDVVVIDRRKPNGEASGGNAGSLHVQLLSWDFGAKAMAGGTPAQQTLPLQRDSVALWKGLERDLQADFEIVTTGGLMVAEDEAQTVFLRQKAEVERQAGIETHVVDRAELFRLAPAISERMVVAAYCPAEGKINPLKATPAIVAEAERQGARFAAGHQVVGIEQQVGGRYRVTSASGARIEAARVVIAAGGWSRHVGRMLGCELPISGAPLQMLVTEPTRPLLKQLVAHADRHLTMKQAGNGNLIIGGAWTATTHSETGYSRVLRSSIEGNLWVAERTIPQLAGLHLLRSWAAMNINIDGAPLLGQLPGHRNVFIAATANGYTLGPMMGLLSAQLALGRRPDRAIEGFTLSRFN